MNIIKINNNLLFATKRLERDLEDFFPISNLKILERNKLNKSDILQINKYISTYKNKKVFFLKLYDIHFDIINKYNYNISILFTNNYPFHPPLYLFYKNNNLIFKLFNKIYNSYILHKIYKYVLKKKIHIYS